MRNAMLLTLFYAVAAAMFAISHMYGGFGAWFLFCASLLFAVYETLAWRSLRRTFAVSRRVSAGRLQAGQDVTVDIDLKITDSAWTPVQWLRVEDVLPTKLAVRRDEPYRVVYPWGRKEFSVQYRLTDTPRGLYRLHAVAVSGGDVFGLLILRVEVHASTQLVVYPRVRKVAYWSAVDQRRLGNRVAHSRSVADATRVIGTREYIPGDRLSRIHWLATARAGTLRSKEFEHYALNELLFILDTSHESFGGFPSSFELALSTVASLAEYAHRIRIVFGYYAFGTGVHHVPPKQGDLTLLRMLEHLAVAEADGQTSFPEGLWRLLSVPRQSTAVVVTRGVTDGLLRFAVLAADRQLRVQLLLARTEQSSLTPEEDALAERLRLFGWQIRTLHSLDSLDTLGSGGSSYAGHA
ncbi:MAG: DUF58 domain-containing protein [Bacilli bacterium]